MQINDDRLTFLLPRPVWVNDMDVAYCSSCNSSFGPLKRRHHCRSCGNIFCHDCSKKSVPLPQLGYGTRPVRVCNGCFDVAYLVTYAIDEDHGLSTQMYGVRGLLELTEKDDDLHNMVAYGGVDALIWLCRASRDTNLHHLVTTVLAMLSEKESIRPVIITKWALPPLLFLIQQYTAMLYQSNRHSSDSSVVSATTSHEKKRTSVLTATDQYAQPYSIQQPSASSSSTTTSVHHIGKIEHSVILEIIINCTHILYQLARVGILSQKDVFTEGILAILFELAAFSAPYYASRESNGIVDENDKDKKLQRQQTMDRVHIIQGLAAKSISCISSIVAFQTSIIEFIVKPQKRPQLQQQPLQHQSNDKLVDLLRSDHHEVQKYTAKTVAYLSLKNDKYKTVLLAEARARALLSIIVSLPMSFPENEAIKWKQGDLAYYYQHNSNIQHDNKNSDQVITVSESSEQQQHQFNSAAVSHACCALANFATNNESQEILMLQPHLLAYICNVVYVFPTQAEIHKHVARFLANLALYEANNDIMLVTAKTIAGSKTDGGNGYNVIPTLLKIGKVSRKSDVQRHIVRAIDNLNSNLPVDDYNGVPSHLHALFEEAYAFTEDILNYSDSIAAADEEPKDADMMKRAKNIMARRKSFLEQQQHGDDRESVEDQQQDNVNESQTITTMDDEGPTLSPTTAATHENSASEEAEGGADLNFKRADLRDENTIGDTSKEEEKEHEPEQASITTTTTTKAAAAAKLTATASSSSEASSTTSTSLSNGNKSEVDDNSEGEETKNDDKSEKQQQEEVQPAAAATQQKAVSTHQKASNNKKRRSKRHK